MGADAAETSALVQTMERLKERRRAIGEEIRNDRPGSPEFRELQAEDMRIAKEMEAVDRQYDEEHRRWHDAFHRRIKDRSFVMHTHPSANALLRTMYPQFLGSLPPHRASVFSQQLYCDAIGNRDIIESFNNRESQLGIIRHPDTGPERKELAALWRNPVDPTQRVFAHGVTVVIVHQSNPVRQMTFEQVEQAYQEHAGNWGAFGAWERSIERIGTGYPLLSWSMFTYHVLGGRRIRFPEELAPEDPAQQPPWEEFLAARREREGRFPGRGPFPRYQDDAKVAEEVAKRINAIGYCLLEPNESLPKNVKALAITLREGQQAYLPIRENIRPATKQDSTELMPSTAPAIANSGYPLVDTFVLYMHPDASPEACEFAAFLTGPEGVAIIKQFGLWPEYELEQVRGEQRVADVKAGKGQPVAVCDLAGVGEALKAAALEFARAKMAVQVTLDAAGGNAEQAVAKLKTGEAELLLVDGGMGERLQRQGMEEGGAEMVLGSRALEEDYWGDTWESLNDGWQEDINVIKGELHKMGIDTVDVPAYFAPTPDGAVSLLPNTVNMLNVNGTLIALHPGSPRFATAMNSALGGTVVAPAITYIDGFELHRDLGGLHCATNTERVPRDNLKRWWEHQ